MARPSILLLASVLTAFTVCVSLPGASARPALFEEGSLTEKEKETVRRVDDLLNQFLEQLAQMHGIKYLPGSPAEDEDNDSPEADMAHAGEESVVPTAPPPSGASGGAAAGGAEGGSVSGGGYPGAIVFPSH